MPGASIAGHKSLIRAAAHMNDNVSLIGTQVANLRTQLDELNTGESESLDMRLRFSSFARLRWERRLSRAPWRRVCGPQRVAQRTFICDRAGDSTWTDILSNARSVAISNL